MVSMEPLVTSPRTKTAPSKSSPISPYTHVSFFQKRICSISHGMNMETISAIRAITYCFTALWKDILEITHNPIPMSMPILFSSSLFALSYIRGTTSTTASKKTCTNKYKNA